MKITGVILMISGAFLLTAAIYFIFSIFKYTRMIGNIFLSLVYKEEVENPASGRGEAITILDSSDHEIEALFVDKKNPKGMVIFCHESGAAKESWEKYINFLPETGYQVLSVNYASKTDEDAKNSLSQWPLFEEVERLLVAVRWAKRVTGNEAPLILFGVSKGADVALAAGAADASVKAVVTDGLFSMKEVFRDYIRKWAPILVKPNFFGQKYPYWVVNLFAELGFGRCQADVKKHFVDVEKLLKSFRSPLLMIHGEEDDYVSGSHQQFLEKISGKHAADHWVVPNAGHNQAVLLARADYQKKITEFLERLN